MKVAGWSVFLVVVVALSGCLGGDPSSPDDGNAEPPDVARSHVVVGVVDSGINAYHAQFRDESAEAWMHPSTYIQGYPLDAPALRLSLNETDWAAAVAKDCDAWNNMEGDVLYWVPGTRIIGLRVTSVWAENIVDCAAGETPLKGLDTWAPHGTGAAGRAAGATTSLCPECKVVMAQGGQTTDAMLWVAEQPWIDVQSNSWGGYLCHEVPGSEAIGCDRGGHELAREATALQVTFAASGNGIRDSITGAIVGIGTPTYLKPAQGHSGVIVVGGHDNGEIILWPGSLPHVVADAWDHPSAAWNQTDVDGEFGGTSGATPFAVGVFARMLLEARVLLGDNGTGLRDGEVALADPSATLPSAGPLADGRLSRTEAERLYMLTAKPRPMEDLPFDGTLGCALDSGYVCIERTNDLGPWTQVPADVPAYYFVGYGQVGTRSLSDAVAVLRGDASVPERPVEDRFFEADAMVRRLVEE